MSDRGRGRAERPCIVVVDDDADDLALLADEVEGRYGGAYEVRVESSASGALTAMEALSGDQRLAIAMARQWMVGMDGSDLLARVRALHPRCKRVLLISSEDWGQVGTAAAIRGAIASGCVDHYLSKPITAADETFHRALSGFLYDWTSSEAGSAYDVTVRDEPELGRPATGTGPHRYDVAVVGAGPAGLAAAV